MAVDAPAHSGANSKSNGRASHSEASQLPLNVANDVEKTPSTVNNNHDSDDKKAAPARHEEQSETEDEDEEDDDSEPKLKYIRLTKSLAPIYRRDDSVSAVLTSGDKKILGTHNGNIHVLNLPSLHTIRQYHAHSATVTDVSVSPFASSFPTPQSTGNRPAPQSNLSSQTTPTKNNTSKTAYPARASSSTAQNEPFYIATASIDGHVCVSALADPKDVILRNFARPIQAVALSPEYGKDRTFLSGGLSGNLILTIGGRTGVSSEANTNSAAAAASGWLGSIGLSSNNGKDTILHSGEGIIRAISWSYTGKYVAWVNEKGIKIMRTSIGLDRTDAELSWKRIAHIDHPDTDLWNAMSGVWKARANWQDDRHVESEDLGAMTGPTVLPETLQRKPSNASVRTTQSKFEQPSRGFSPVERLLVGWGDTAWVIDVRPRGFIDGKLDARQKSLGKASIVHHVVISDGIVSGLAQYTAKLLLVVVFRTRDDDNQPVATKEEHIHKKGVRRRRNALPPDLRLIDLSADPEQEVDVESLPFSRFESLSAADYFVSTLFNSPFGHQMPVQNKALAGFGVSAFGGAIWDAGRQSTRIFSSSASILSGSSSGQEKTAPETSSREMSASNIIATAATPSLLTPGLKIFVHSPYDCLLALKRDAADKLRWLLDRRSFGEAWDLVDRHPEIVQDGTEDDSRPETPLPKVGSLADFFQDNDSSLSHHNGSDDFHSTHMREKRRIGDSWLSKLVAEQKWQQAAQTASKVLQTSSSWEHWIKIFANANELDQITPYIPIPGLKPQLPASIYELVLLHYLEADVSRFEALVDIWGASLLNIDDMTKATRAKLESLDQSSHNTRIVLLNSLAKLYIEASRPAEALDCYMQTRNGPAVLELVGKDRLLPAVADQIYEFITVNIPDGEKTPSINQLDEWSSEAVHILASGAIQKHISVDEIVRQLEPLRPRSAPFLFFIFRSLWNGNVAFEQVDSQSAMSAAPRIRRHRFERKGATITAKASTRALLSTYVNLAVSLFAEYSRSLLGDLLKYSDDSGVPLTEQSGFYEHALAECEKRNYIPELVNLLSATGQTRRALHLIIDEIGNVKQAIDFAKDVDDEELWQDLLNYSMDKPLFVTGLLLEGGSSGCRLKPEELVRRIPNGLDIPGLKEGLVAVLRDSDVQSSIAEGAARVSHSEVAQRLDELIQHRMQGVLFELTPQEKSSDFGGGTSVGVVPVKSSGGKCAICTEIIHSPNMEECGEDAFTGNHLVAFQCGHIFHLECILDDITNHDNAGKIASLQDRLDEKDSTIPSASAARRTVGAKMARAQMIDGILGTTRCKACQQ